MNRKDFLSTILIIAGIVVFCTVLSVKNGIRIQQEINTISWERVTHQINIRHRLFRTLLYTIPNTGSNLLDKIQINTTKEDRKTQINHMIQIETAFNDMMKTQSQNSDIKVILSEIAQSDKRLHYEVTEYNQNAKVFNDTINKWPNKWIINKKKYPEYILVEIETIQGVQNALVVN